MTRRVLAVRLDSMGDVLLTGPAVRARAGGGARVTFLTGPRGRDAAELLPGVDDVVTFEAPWVVYDPAPVRPPDIEALVEELRALELDEAVVFTSFHQSPLPTALLLRLAGVRRISAICEDYPGSLLDVRHQVADDVHEVERALSLAAAAGYALPAGDDARLAVTLPGARRPARGNFVVVHPGAAVPARAWSPRAHRELVRLLTERGRRVYVTGSTAEAELTAYVAGDGPSAADLGGRLSLAELADLLAGVSALVAGNTGPAHLAAAVGTPVVSLFAPTVPAARWRPWGVPHALLGDQEIPCAGCRARECPVPGHPCLESVTPVDVVRALEGLEAEVCAFEEAELKKPMVITGAER
jgi:ADP-heptose:LPS heptosyltransferase